MTGYEILKKALIRLGIKNENNSLNLRATEYINQISSDLKGNIIENLSDTVSKDNELCEAITVGLVMLFSLTIGDLSANKIYTDLYNAKRAKLLSVNDTVEDKLPKGDSL